MLVSSTAVIALAWVVYRRSAKKRGEATSDSGIG
jgi:hypothetical protein